MSMLQRIMHAHTYTQVEEWNRWREESKGHGKEEEMKFMFLSHVCVFK